MLFCSQILEKFGIKYELIISSAHRTPDRTKSYTIDAQKRGAKVFICAAGMAAHLAGVVASLTTLPVIGVPIASGDLRGLDALYSTVAMPSGIPVATVAIGKAGAINSAYLAAQILSIYDNELRDKLLKDKEEQTKKIANDSKEIEILL